MFVAKQSLSALERSSEASPRDAGYQAAFERLKNLWAQRRAAEVRVREQIRRNFWGEFELRSNASQRLREHIDAQVGSSSTGATVHRLDFLGVLDVPGAPQSVDGADTPRERRLMPKSGTRRLNLPESALTRSQEKERQSESLRPKPLDLLG